MKAAITVDLSTGPRVTAQNWLSTKGAEMQKSRVGLPAKSLLEDTDRAEVRA